MRRLFAWSALVFAALAACTSFSADDAAPTGTPDAGADGAPPSGQDGAAPPDAGVDDAGLENDGDAAPGPPRQHRYIWLTLPARADFSSIASADAYCASHRPDSLGITKTKALLVGTSRRACVTVRCSTGPGEHLDWPLVSGTEYRRPDGTVVGTTDANGLFSVALTASIGTDNSLFAWTGLGGSNTWLNDLTCTDWSSSAAGLYGRAGYTGPSYVAAGQPFGQFSATCNNAHGLVCVETR